MGHLAAGVTVVTAAEDGVAQGATVSSVTSLSLDPPRLICCLAKGSATAQAVQRTGTFVLNILEQGQAALAERFALGLPAAEKFAGLALVADPTGVPLLADALASVVCQVREVSDAGSHLIFVGEAVRAETRPGSPLAYYRGAFGYVVLDDDLPVRDRLRNALLAGALEAGRPLVLEELTAALDAPAPAVQYALRELMDEGLVARDPEAGYTVADPRVHRADAARGRVALEAGVLLSIAPRGAQLDALRASATRAATAAAAGHDAAGEIHAALHGALVGLAGSRALQQAHRHVFPAAARGRDVTPALAALVACDRRAIEAAARRDARGVQDALGAHLALELSAI